MYRYALAGAALLIIVAAVGGYMRGYENGEAKVRQQWDRAQADMMAKHAEAVEKAREKEQDLQKAADKLRQEKDREIRDVVARNTALVNSLRDRQSRSTADSSAVPNTPSAGQSACTGKQLYREDGEFLVRVAREADELRTALKQCYAQYESVRQTVK
jgi:hypothetical protein